MANLRVMASNLFGLPFSLLGPNVMSEQRTACACRRRSFSDPWGPQTSPRTLLGAPGIATRSKKLRTRDNVKNSVAAGSFPTS